MKPSSDCFSLLHVPMVGVLLVPVMDLLCNPMSAVGLIDPSIAPNFFLSQWFRRLSHVTVTVVE